MVEMTVKNLMIPLSEYATISENATLADAHIALEKAQEKYNKTQHSYRSILVMNDKSRIVGKISLMNILVGLEPKYKQFGNLDLLSRFGFPVEFYEYMMKHVDILQKPLDDICSKAATLRVKDIMQVPDKNSHIEENDSLNQAIHQLVTSNQQSLMVTRKEEIVGILRLVDVVAEIGSRMKACTPS